MAVEEVIEVPFRLLGGIISVGRWLETIGVIVIVWLIFSIVNFFINRKKLRNIMEIKEDLEKIESRLERIERKLK